MSPRLVTDLLVRFALKIFFNFYFLHYSGGECAFDRHSNKLSGRFSQLGNGLRYGFEAFPTAIDYFNNDEGSSVVSVACGDYHSLAVTDDGKLYSWGWATFQGSESMSPGALKGNDALPQQIEGELSARKVCLVAGGRRHTLVATQDHQLFSLGIGENGQLGCGSTDNTRLPKRILELSGVPLASLSAGWGHSVAITTGGEVYAWGWNEEGQCGIGHREQAVLTPQKIVALKGVQVRFCAAGADHTILLDSCGNVFAFGSSKMHQLGVEQDDALNPIQIKIPAESGGVISAACGFGHSLFVSASGRVFSLGHNSDGQCGAYSLGIMSYVSIATVC